MRYWRNQVNVAKFVTLSRPIAQAVAVRELVGATLLRWRLLRGKTGQIVLGWGRRPLGRSAQKRAEDLGLAFWCLEDGFLRSFAPGAQAPALSLVVDGGGIYYDDRTASDLENLLNGDAGLAGDDAADVRHAMDLILAHDLSKYNHAPALRAGLLRDSDTERILLVDQTVGDMSVLLGSASAASFEQMLRAARNEHPRATLYIKTHPEVNAGRKLGYLTAVQEDGNTVLLREDLNPLALLRAVDRVFVVTSTMGFEALLVGKPVSCFGVPWYAGWGLTDDRITPARRRRTRTVHELFSAAYLRYARYLDPVTGRRGSIFDVIQWLVRQKEHATRGPTLVGAQRVVGVGMPRWKQRHVSPMLSRHPDRLQFVPDVVQARNLALSAQDACVCWGPTLATALRDLADASGARMFQMEDGFIRSVGLGSDFIRPLSLVLDERGIYFDATRPSDLECILNEADFLPQELDDARKIRRLIVEHGITKYNLESRQSVAWDARGRLIVLVPGQVEDDASIRLGCTDICTNLGLLRAVRLARPDAYIVYKPHPDVLTANRRGQLRRRQALEYADHIETLVSIVSCIDACDELHTMTSLSGFDALLRGKPVFTYGQPFYAGWGLTRDRDVYAGADGALARRSRVRSIDELVAGVLLRYPVYWDWELKGYTTCEAVIHRIIRTRDALEASGTLGRLRDGIAYRLLRKLRGLCGLV